MKSAAELLLDTARRGELHYSIILHGPAHEELQSLALRAAKALNCLNRTTGDDCIACQRIDRRIHPDVHFVEVAGDRKQISVDQIRDIVENAMLRPYEGRTKVFIIDPASALEPQRIECAAEDARGADARHDVHPADALAGSAPAHDPLALAGDLRRRRRGSR